MSMSVLESLMLKYKHEPHENYYKGNYDSEELMCKHCGAICFHDYYNNTIRFGKEKVTGISDNEMKFYCERYRSLA